MIMITNYIPNICKYNVNNLKKVVHIFSEASNKVYIDNGEAYVTGTVYDFQTISATSVSYNETTSYDDRFKFSKALTVTVDGFVKLSALNEKYYVVIEDENGILWLINEDFPSLVTYTYTLEDGTDSTVFTFNALSNFPTLKLNATIGNFNECKSYSLVKVENLKMLEKRYANIDASSSIIYGYSNQVYKTVKFNEGSLSVEEVFDGTNVNTTIQFSINMDDYQSSWHYNVLEYPYNKYVAVIDHLACGFEMGLVPSFNAQGSEIDGSNDTVTITLIGGSQKGSEWANSWTEVTVAPAYTWRLSKEWICMPTRWVDGGFTCSGRTGHDKYSVEKLQTKNDQDEWVDTDPLISAGTLVELKSTECGYVAPPKIYEESTQNPYIYRVYCDSSTTLTRSEVWGGSSYFHKAVIGDCVTEIGDRAFMEENTRLADLTSVTFTDYCQVERIGGAAFYQCIGLSNFVIPPTVTYIGGSAFAYCPSPKRADIPSGMTTIESQTFFNSGIREVTIPSGVTSIGASAFSLTYLSSITFDENSQLSSIGASAFRHCQKLTNIDIPSGVTSIGESAFYECTELRTINQPNSTASLDLPSVTNIGVNGFDYCVRITSVNLPSIKNLAEGAFYHCEAITSCTIGDELEYIGRAAFGYCTNLTSIVLPASVTRIERYAFSYCTKLRSVTVLATTPPFLVSNAFANSWYPTIYVPPQSLALYEANTGWANCGCNIFPIPNT